jgi:hypothetical protein
LSICLADDRYTAMTAVSNGEIVGGVVAAHRSAMPPFTEDAERSWLLDDFYVRSPDLWDSVGVHLLRSVVRTATDTDCERLIAVTAQRDLPKRTMLIRAGFKSAACWWVGTVKPPTGVSVGVDIPMTIGPAPSVYDPGGPTALVRKIIQPSEIAEIERIAYAAKAVIAIVPARTTDHALQIALTERGYHVSSEWFVQPVVRHPG